MPWPVDSKLIIRVIEVGILSTSTLFEAALGIGGESFILHCVLFSSVCVAISDVSTLDLQVILFLVALGC